MRKNVIKHVFALVLLALFAAQPVWAFDFSQWDGLLKKYVAAKTINGVKLNAVDYQKLAKDPAYTRLLNDLKKASLADLKTSKDKLVFWMNAYNVMAVKMVLDHYPVKSIKDAGSFFKAVWKKDVGTVGGKVRTLNEIEHVILRKLGEPRIHVAIVCASVSCPDLRKEAYTVKDIDAQLDDQLKLFLANKEKGLRVDSTKKRVHLSSIFKWFKEDFDSKGGVVKYLTPFAPESAQGTLKSGSPHISYLDYDWGLNELSD
ncbi:MAG: DUF547 domain-containing protein [Nitrospirales bacterium]